MCKDQIVLHFLHAGQRKIKESDDSNNLRASRDVRSDGSLFDELAITENGDYSITENEGKSQNWLEYQSKERLNGLFE